MTKKNKKVLAIISTLFLLMYILSSSLLFTLTESQEVSNYSSFTYDLWNHHYNYDLFSTFTADEFAANYTVEYVGPIYSSFPFVMALYDENGNIVAQSGSFIGIKENDSEKENLRDDVADIIFIDKYLTDDIKKQIIKFREDTYFVDIIELNYTETDDEIIPISFTLIDKADPENTIKIVLSDEEYTNTIKKDVFKDGMYIRFVDINNRSRHHKTYKQLRQRLIDDKDYVMDHFKAGSGGGYGGPDGMYNLTNVTLADGEYMLYVVSEFDSVRETLLSRSFTNIMTYQTVFFVVFYIISVALLTVYYKRNKKLEDAKIAFTSAAAHELKTPLAVIENQCECIMENIAPEKNEEYVKSIYSESLRMNKLVATLLQYNRLASAESIKKEKCDLTEIVKAEIEKYRPLADAKNILLETYISKNKVEINCNKELIALVIDNYLSNAVKHTDKNRRIVVTLSQDTFSVFNKGKNINPESEKNLWDIFYRDDDARNSEDNSTGMGLAICKQILEQHKYKYGFINKPDGVEFYFKIS